MTAVINFSDHKIISLILVIFLLTFTTSQELPKVERVSKLLEQIEMQEAKLRQQKNLDNVLTRLEARLETLQQFQLNRVQPIELRVEELEQKLLGFVKLPELMTQLEERIETVIQLEAQNILPIQDKLNDAYKKLTLCSDVKETVGKLDGCINSITEEQNIVDRIKRLEITVKSSQADAVSLSAVRKKGTTDMDTKINLLIRDIDSLKQTDNSLKQDMQRYKDVITQTKIAEKLAANKMVEVITSGQIDAMNETLSKILNQTSSNITKVITNAFDKLEQDISLLKQTDNSLKQDVLSLKDFLKREKIGDRLAAQEKLNTATSNKIKTINSTINLILNRNLQEKIGERLSAQEKLNKATSNQLKTMNSTISLMLKENVLNVPKNISKIISNLKQDVQNCKNIFKQEKISERLSAQEKLNAITSNQIKGLNDVMNYTLVNIILNITENVSKFRRDISSLNQTDDNLKKEVISCKNLFKQEKVKERLLAQEKLIAAASNQIKSVNNTITNLLEDNLIQIANNQSLLHFYLKLTQEKIRTDVSSLRQNDDDLKNLLLDLETQLKSNYKDVRSNTEKLKRVEETLSRYNNSSVSKAALIQLVEDNISRYKIPSVSENNRSNARFIALEKDSSDSKARFIALEKDSRLAKKERAILYDNIKKIEEDLRQNEAHTNAENVQLSSLKEQCANLSLDLQELRTQVTFFHSEFSINTIVDVPRKRSQLHMAAIEGDTKRVLFLLRKGADTEVQDYKKWRPLHLAAWQGQTEVVRTLLQAGAKVDPLDEYKYTPLHWAAQYGKESCVDLLLTAGANIEARDINDETPLHKAAWYEQSQMVEYLLNRGAKINAYRKERYTALHLAAQKGYLTCVKVLVAKGANIHLKTIDGFTALDLALSNKHQAVVNYLNQYSE